MRHIVQRLSAMALAAGLFLSCQFQEQPPVQTSPRPEPSATMAPEPQTEGLEVDLNSGHVLVGGRILNAQTGARIQETINIAVTGPVWSVFCCVRGCNPLWSAHCV